MDHDDEFDDDGPAECPECDGSGLVCRDCGYSEDECDCLDATGFRPCDSCNGSGIVEG